MIIIPLWLQALFWGGFSGSALILGSLIGYFFKLKQRLVAGIMAFGSGVLIAVISFELMEGIYLKDELISTAIGFVLGSFIYTLANRIVSTYGAKHRKRSNLNNKLNEDQMSGSGLAIAIGALIDGIPESIIIGLGILQGGTVSLIAVIAIFLSNIPEGLSSSIGMKSSGKKLSYIMAIWGSIAVTSAIFACLGYLFFQNVEMHTIKAVMAIAAGAILSMIVDTMIPEAFEKTHDFSGFITVIGFLCIFILDKI